MHTTRAVVTAKINMLVLTARKPTTRTLTKAVLELEQTLNEKFIIVDNKVTILPRFHFDPSTLG